MMDQIQPTSKYKVSNIALILGVDRKTIYNWMDAGDLPFNLLPAKKGQKRTPRFVYGKVLINYMNKYQCQAYTPH